jgi:hypothetical protein
MNLFDLICNHHKMKNFLREKIKKGPKSVPNFGFLRKVHNAAGGKGKGGKGKEQGVDQRLQQLRATHGVTNAVQEEMAGILANEVFLKWVEDETLPSLKEKREIWIF